VCQPSVRVVPRKDRSGESDWLLRPRNEAVWPLWASSSERSLPPKASPESCERTFDGDRVEAPSGQLHAMAGAPGW